MNGYLFPALSMSPSLLEGFIQRIDSGRLDERMDPERFSPREVIGHMFDWEPILRERMETAVRAPGSQIIGIDEWERAKQVGYSTMDVASSVEGFKAERSKTVAFLRGLTPAQMNLEFNHNELGPMSVKDYAMNTLGHDVYHMEQLQGYL